MSYRKRVTASVLSASYPLVIVSTGWTIEQTRMRQFLLSTDARLM